MPDIPIPAIHELGAGFRLVIEPNRRRRVETVEPNRIVDALGTRLFNPLARAFELADRVSALEQLIAYSVMLEPDGLAAARNVRASFFLLVGTMYEVRNVLTDLNRAGVRAALSDPQVWDELDDLRRRSDRTDLRDIRNTVSFHIDAEVVATGIEHMLTGPTPVTLFALDGLRKQDFTFPVGSDVLVRGTGIDDRDIPRLLHEVGDDHPKLARLLMDVFVALLAAKGIQLEIPPELLPRPSSSPLARGFYAAASRGARRAARALWKLSWRLADAGLARAA